MSNIVNLNGYDIRDAYARSQISSLSDNKADKSTTLAGYGITDAYTKSEVDTLISDASNMIETITGSLTITANSGNNVDIDYPVGYTMTNCVPISFGIDIENTQGINYLGYYVDSSDSLRVSYQRALNFKTDKINVQIKNPTTSDKIVNYKIVVMKIATPSQNQQ